MVAIDGGQYFVLCSLLNGFLEPGKTTLFRSSIESMVRCGEADECLSFFYRNQDKLCQFASTIHSSSDGLTPTPGFKYYVADTVCGAGWTYDSGQCYRYMTDRKNHSEAEKSCQRIGGHLAITDSMEDHAIMVSIGKAFGKDFWIGGSKEPRSRRWAWSNGQTITLDLWGNGEPNGAFLENCVEIKHLSKWNDDSCDSVEQYLCEKDM